ncbi:MAG TPA: ABC transporter ATP-binding protein [Longimicrobiales bacterium]
MTDDVMVRVERLGRSFGGLQAVSDLSFEVRRGELFGLVGPDGAGKTTTLRMLAGVLRPTEGDAVLDGISVAREPEAVKPHLAYMSQRFGLYADLSVRENLEFYADLFEVPRAARSARLDRLYAFSNLREFEDRLAGNLSGGMKQKLGLSCALIHQPKILLLDEPTFGVDPISRRDLWVIVHQMVTDGVTVIVSTAYMDEAERFDRLVLLHGGRALAIDTPDALQQDIGGELIALEVDRVRAASRLLSGHPLVLQAVVFGERLHVKVRSADEALPTLRDVLRGAGFDVRVIERAAPSLEDVFIDRIARAEAA